VFLLLNVLAGLLRAVRGPTPADRMIAAYLFGTTAVAILLLLAEAFEQEALLDVALVFVVLAAVATSVFVTFPRARGRPS
jgi:multicomponent Na+:H+ antiporter subunit F